MRIAAACFLLLLVAGRSDTRTQTPDILPKTAVGAIVREYIAAFNGGDSAAIAAFFTRHVSEEGNRRGPIPQRIARTLKARVTMGTITPLRLNGSTDSTVALVVRTGSGRMLEMEFRFEAPPSRGFAGMMLRDAGDDSPPPTRAASDDAWVAASVAECAALADSDRFSGVILLAHGDSILAQRAYGLANRESGLRNTPATLFNVGSINKSFTSFAVRQLADRGALRLDDTVGTYLPEYPNPEVRGKVTVAQLLEMTSGIGDFFGERYDATPKDRLRSLRDYLPLFADLPLEFAPGTRERYSNGGFIVLGLIVERVSGDDYYSYIREHLFVPAGMTTAAWVEKTTERADVARGYTGAGAKRQWNFSSLPQKGSSAGGGYATALDLFRYTRLVKNDAVTPVSFPGRMGMGIAGGAPGLNAALEWERESDYTVVVLSNLDPPSAERVARKIMRSSPGGR